MAKGTYQGREVELDKPFRESEAGGKFAVYVKNPKTNNIIKVRFGDPDMSIKRKDPARRRSFEARHSCSMPGPKTKARYWSCWAWDPKNDLP